jgi:hypothetical protein
MIDPVSAPKNFPADSASKLHLTEAEKEKAMKVLIAAKPHDSVVPLVAYAWGVNGRTLRNWYKSMIYSNGTKVKRKERSDAGKTLITSDKKRQSIYTPYFVFAKLLRKENPDQSYSAADIKSAWLTASHETKAFCSKKADEWIQQGPFLLQEIHKALISTAGSVSWTQVATLVSGTGNLEIISDKTIRQFVMSLPESSYQSTRILPKLDEANRLRRLWWSHQFWIFWKSAVAFNNGVQILLVHMDEKWFWCIAVRPRARWTPLSCPELLHNSLWRRR